ncbi:hypothetical protein V1477_015176, partial [Vespula maculifrons]
SNEDAVIGPCNAGEHCLEKQRDSAHKVELRSSPAWTKRRTKRRVVWRGLGEGSGRMGEYGGGEGEGRELAKTTLRRLPGIERSMEEEEFGVYLSSEFKLDNTCRVENDEEKRREEKRREEGTSTGRKEMQTSCSRLKY